MHGEVGEVFNVHGLQAVSAVAEHAEDWQPAQHPRDVVDEDVLVAEEYGRAENRVAKAAFNQCTFESRLAAEVFQRGIVRRIGNADVNDALHLGLFCRVKQLERIVDGIGLLEQLVSKSHPIGIVKNISALERGDELRRIVEVVGTHRDARVEGIRALR